MTKEFNEKLKILVVDDEPDYCDVMKMIFTSHGYGVDVCNNGVEALEKIKIRAYDLVLTDLMMPQMDGTELLQQIKSAHPETHVIMMTAYGTIENAVDTMKMGAYTYVTKGDNPEKLITEIRLLEENLAQKKEGQEAASMGEEGGKSGHYLLDSNSRKFKTVLDMARKAAKSNANVLLLGESGSGKEVLAKYIHDNSSRRNKRFVNLNCHSIPETMLESELFGHEKGSFTGAVATRVGRIESADYGTLFLDEIGGTSISLQTKLLKVIENKTISRVGSNQERPVDFRLITATHNQLEEDIRKERFRADLFYRISTIVIKVPALRHRKEDLPLLIDYLLKRNQQETGKSPVKISEALMDTLLRYDYPGNIRELKNIIDRLLVFSENGENPEPESLLLHSSPTQQDPAYDEKTLRQVRKEMESKYILSLVETYQGDCNQISEILGITRRQLWNKLTEYGIKTK